MAPIPATVQLHDAPATTSVISNGSQNPAIVFTRPVDPGCTRPVDGSTAVIVTPQDGQCSKLEIRSQTTSGGEAMSSEERSADTGPMLARPQRNRRQIRRFADTHRYSFRDQC